MNSFCYNRKSRFWLLDLIQFLCVLDLLVTKKHCFRNWNWIRTLPEVTWGGRCFILAGLLCNKILLFGFEMLRIWKILWTPHRTKQECKCIVQVWVLYSYKYILHYFLCSCVVSQFLVDIKAFIGAS